MFVIMLISPFLLVHINFVFIGILYNTNWNFENLAASIVYIYVTTVTINFIVFVLIITFLSARLISSLGHIYNAVKTDMMFLHTCGCCCCL